METAFNLTWASLSKEAQQLGCRLSLFAPAPFDWSLVERCAIFSKDEEERKKAKKELEDIRAQLCCAFGDRFLRNRPLSPLTEEPTYRLHPLIREFFQTKLAELAEADEYKRNFCAAMVAVAKEIPDPPVRQQILALAPAIPHLAEAAKELTDWVKDEDLISPFVGLGRFYEGQGAYEQSESWYEQCLEITLTRLGEDHRLVATSLNNLALVQQSQGRYEQAESLYQQALELYKRLLVSDHPGVAQTLNNLAALYYKQGRYEQAESLYQQAKELYKRRLGSDHLYVAQTLNNLATLYYKQKRYEQAEPLYQEALELCKQLRLENHPHVAGTLNNLANLYSDQGRYSEAEPLFQQAKELYKRLLVSDHPYVAISWWSLAALYKNQEDYEKAEPLYQQALEIAEKKLSSDHPHTISIREDLVFVRQKKRDFDGE